MLVRSLLALLATPLAVLAASSSGSRILVALEKSVDKDAYSAFWASLEQRGYQLTFKGAKDQTPALTEFDERAFDHVVLFAPSSKAYSPDLSPQALVRYLSLKGNILLALSPSISEFNRDFAREFSLEFQPSDTYLLDHSAFVPSLDDSDSSPHTALALPAAESLIRNAAIVSDETFLRSGPLLYRGIAHELVTGGGSRLVVPVLKGSKASYSAEPRVSEGPDDSPYPQDFLAGSKAALATGFQTLDNARVMVVGSLDVFSDAFWNPTDFETSDGVMHARSANSAFVRDITQWAFQEKGVLRVVSATHHRDGETEERSVYRIKDDVTYTIALQEHVSKGNSSTWVPASHLSDVQLEFTMLDPHIRADLEPVNRAGQVPGASEYAASFRVPDRHGVFKFLVDYKRPGWSFLESSQTVSVVPFRHDEYPRFIFGAWPYYLGAASTTVAFLVFGALWLRLPREAVAKGKKDE